MNQWTNDPSTDDEFDAMLRRAVQSRPEPEVGADLARRVLRAARAEAAAAPPPARRGEWVVWISAAAGLLAVVMFGYWRLAALEAARAAYDSASAATNAASADVAGPLLLMGLGALAASAVYLAAQASLSQDDEPLRPGLG